MKPHEIVTVMKINVEDRDKLKEISKATGMHMKFILGKLIDKKHKETFKG